MVRENKDLPVSKGFDGDKGTRLNESLEADHKAMFETAFPEGEPNKEPIDIRADARPAKKG